MNRYINFTPRVIENEPGCNERYFVPRSLQGDPGHRQVSWSKYTKKKCIKDIGRKTFFRDYYINRSLIKERCHIPFVKNGRSGTYTHSYKTLFTSQGWMIHSSVDLSVDLSPLACEDETKSVYFENTLKWKYPSYKKKTRTLWWYSNHQFKNEMLFIILLVNYEGFWLKIYYYVG